jgi:ElaB/YqjD/DUF883 family membrane-anchored ribosome-binding protein
MRTKSGNGHNVDLEKFAADIKTVVQHGEELLKAGMTNVKARAISGAKTTDRAVRKHPYQSLGIVFGLGVFVGIMVTGLLTGEFDPETD